MSKSHETDLYQWHSPIEFSEIQAALFNKVGDQEYRKRDHKNLREAWILSLFARGIECAEVRLSVVDPPDGEVKLDGKVVPIEVTEALDPDRKPDGDLKTGIDRSARTPGEWDAESAIACDCLLGAISKKESKDSYAPSTVLIVYLNIGHDVRAPDPEIIRLISEVSSRKMPNSHFDGVCVIWRDRLFGPTSIVTGGEVSLARFL